MSSTVGTLVTLSDVLTEGVSGQYLEVDLTDAADVPIDTSAIVGITGTLRAIDTGEALFEEADLLAAPARATYPGAPGRVRVTFTSDDMASRVLSGRPQEFQTRRLALSVTHSEDQLFHCGVQFTLHNLGDVGMAPALFQRRVSRARPSR